MLPGHCILGQTLNKIVATQWVTWCIAKINLKRDYSSNLAPDLCWLHILCCGVNINTTQYSKSNKEIFYYKKGNSFCMMYSGMNMHLLVFCCGLSWINTRVKLIKQIFH